MGEYENATCSRNMQCASCKCCPEFQKIAHLGESGLEIYKYNVASKPDPALLNMNVKNVPQRDRGDNIFILNNTKNIEVSVSCVIQQLDKTTPSCPRCKYILKHAQNLLTCAPCTNKRGITGICDHCYDKRMLKDVRCQCEEVIQKFAMMKNELNEFKKRQAKRQQISPEEIQMFLQKVKTPEVPKFGPEIGTTSIQEEVDKLLRPRSGITPMLAVSSFVVEDDISKPKSPETTSKTQIYSKDQDYDLMAHLDKYRALMDFIEKYYDLLAHLDKYKDQEYLMAHLDKYQEFMAHLNKYNDPEYSIPDLDKYKDLMAHLDKYKDQDYLMAHLDKYNDLMANLGKYNDLMAFLDKYKDQEYLVTDLDNQRLLETEANLKEANLFVTPQWKSTMKSLTNLPKTFSYIPRKPSIGSFDFVFPQFSKTSEKDTVAKSSASLIRSIQERLKNEAINRKKKQEEEENRQQLKTQQALKKKLAREEKKALEYMKRQLEIELGLASTAETYDYIRDAVTGKIIKKRRKKAGVRGKIGKSEDEEKSLKSYEINIYKHDKKGKKGRKRKIREDEDDEELRDEKRKRGGEIRKKEIRGKRKEIDEESEHMQRKKIKGKFKGKTDREKIMKTEETDDSLGDTKEKRRGKGRKLDKKEKLKSEERKKGEKVKEEHKKGARKEKVESKEQTRMREKEEEEEKGKEKKKEKTKKEEVADKEDRGKEKYKEKKEKENGKHQEGKSKEKTKRKSYEEERKGVGQKENKVKKGVEGEKGEKKEKRQKGEKAEKGEKGEKGEKVEKGGKGRKGVKDAKAEKGEKQDKGEKEEKMEKDDKEKNAEDEEEEWEKERAKERETEREHWLFLDEKDEQNKEGELDRIAERYLEKKKRKKRRKVDKEDIVDTEGGEFIEEEIKEEEISEVEKEVVVEPEKDKGEMVFTFHKFGVQYKTGEGVEGEEPDYDTERFIHDFLKKQALELEGIDKMQSKSKKQPDKEQKESEKLEKKKKVDKAGKEKEIQDQKQIDISEKKKESDDDLGIDILLKKKKKVHKEEDSQDIPRRDENKSKPKIKDVELLAKVLAKQERDRIQQEKRKKALEDRERILRDRAAKNLQHIFDITPVREAKATRKEPPPKHQPKEDKKPEADPADLFTVKPKDIKIRKPSQDDLILKLIKLRQGTREAKTPKTFELTPSVIDLLCNPKKTRAKEKSKIKSESISEYEDLDYQASQIEELVLREEIRKISNISVVSDELVIKPLAFQTALTEQDVKEAEREPEFLEEIKSPTKVGRLSVSVPGTVSAKSPRTAAVTASSTEPLVEGTGIIRYALSDRKFIENGWTLLPTEKVVRKVNMYRMRPSRPEFDWFSHNKDKGTMQYDSGDKLAEIDNNGRGRWYYRNGRVALDYYNSEDVNAQQRYVIYSSGEPDERGRSHPITVLAMFDYMGSGIVFDHAGKIRLKYNQYEGVVLDREIGPVSRWKWHTLNDPPVLQQVMIDTHMAYKDPVINALNDEKVPREPTTEEEMLAIEYENLIKEKNKKKIDKKFTPFHIKTKVLKINDQFSLRVLDQATIYLLFRDGSTNLKLNLGMLLDHNEIVDTDVTDIEDVSHTLTKFPAKTDSVAQLQLNVAETKRTDRIRQHHENHLRPPGPVFSVDKMTASTSRPLRLTASDSTTLCGCHPRKPLTNIVYYDTRIV